jgi:LPS export ABC transporter protein LptC
MIKRLFILPQKLLTRIFIPGVLFVVFTQAACNNDPEQIKALTSKTAVQEDKATDVIFIHSEHGKVKARLSAHIFVRNEVAKPPYTDLKEGIKVEFYDDSGLVSSTLKAGYARYYEQQGNILIRDNVVIVNKKGEQLNTEELVWNQKVEQFYTEKFVKITTATQVLYGDGLEANKDFTWYHIKNLKGTVQVNKNEVPQ